MTNTKYALSVGWSEENQKWEGFAYCTTDNSVFPARCDKLHTLLQILSRRVKEKEKKLKDFPLPTNGEVKSKLILPNDLKSPDTSPPLIVPGGPIADAI